MFVFFVAPYIEDATLALGAFLVRKPVQSCEWFFEFISQIAPWVHILADFRKAVSR